MTFSTIPLWLVALVFAAIAPWCVRAFADVMEKRLRRRTADVLARAGRIEGEREERQERTHATEEISARRVTSEE